MRKQCKGRNRVLGVSMAVMLAVTGMPFHALATDEAEGFSLPVSAPRVHENGFSVWDCVWFGHYWQTDTNGNGETDQEDDLQPIKWRVLSVEGDEVFLVSDTNLDAVPFEKTNLDASWKNCFLRSWLNGYGPEVNIGNVDCGNDNFFDTAFTEEEQAEIADSLVVTKDNPVYGTSGGGNTTDKVFLLSVEEVTNPDYGFCSDAAADSDTRVSLHSRYTYEGGTWKAPVSSFNIGSTSTNYWWLRTSGQFRLDKVYVDSLGKLALNGREQSENCFGVRPALRVKRSAFEKDVCKYAGFTETDEDKYELGSADTGRKVSSPRVYTAEKHVVYDCVWFGQYWQNDTNGDGKADKNDGREPILWRVLEAEGDDIFLVADKCLDVRKYNETYIDVTWETCTLRSWMNGYDAPSNTCGISYREDGFLVEAFSQQEQNAIKETELDNKRTNGDIDGGNPTTDKVFGLSYDDLKAWEYGFTIGAGLRRCHTTEYPSGACLRDWWLRSIGSRYSAGGVVYSDGRLGGMSVDYPSYGVRSALHIDLSKIDSGFFSYAGTVSRYEGGRTVLSDISPVVPTPTPMPSVLPTEPQTTYDRKKLRVSLLSVKLNRYNAPVLRWNRNLQGNGYQLYRSVKKNSGYRLIKDFSSAKIQSYADKKTAGKKRYYYRLRCYRKAGGKLILGEFGKTMSVQTLNLKKPKIKGKKGTTATGIPFVELRLVRFGGSKLTIYYRTRGQSYRVLKLTSNSIRKNRGRFMIKCSGRGRVYWFKVRTSMGKNKRTYYSKYSNVVKIKR